MKEIKAVIGKNFGDEGKGKVVDILCREAADCGKRTLIIRHNGGAQAGHTVEGPVFRFVHHQLGSGTRQGADTCWSSTFLPDLLKLGEEIAQYEEAADQAGMRPLPVHIYASGECVFTTVYDVMLNQMAEELRGTMRHGSCGMGIYETTLRSAHPEYAFRLKDLRGGNAGETAELLRKIRDNYMPGRMKEILGENSVPEYWKELILDENLLFRAAEEMTENFRRYVILTEPAELVKRYDTIIFENAQGLLLDQDREDYAPHLTASYTGLTNILAFLEQCRLGGTELPPLEIHYVTRAYVTRHGAGRLECECGRQEISPSMVDWTNVPNPWQGKLRYGKHPGIQAFFEDIRRDLELLDKYPAIKARAFCAVSHLDETDNKILFADRPRSLQELMRAAGEERNLLFEKAGRERLIPLS